MRTDIRSTNLVVLHGDVDDTMPLLVIDDAANYRSTLVIDRPNHPTVRRVEILPGARVRAAIRTQLLVSMHEVEQDDPHTITVRWTRRNRLSRTQSCTYTKV